MSLQQKSPQTAFFAKSEPPAHDDWIYDSWKDEKEEFVRTTVNKIWYYLQEQFAPILADSSGSDQTSLCSLGWKIGRGCSSVYPRHESEQAYER